MPTKHKFDQSMSFLLNYIDTIIYNSKLLILLLFIFMKIEEKYIFLNFFKNKNS